MGVHHSEKHLDILVLLFTRRLLVLVQLGDLFAANLQQNLLWLLGFKHLCDAAEMHSVYFKGVGLKFLSVDHGRSRHTRLLIECVLHSLLLQPEVLLFLLEHALALKVILSVFHLELPELLLLSLLYRDVP